MALVAQHPLEDQHSRLPCSNRLCSRPSLPRAPSLTESYMSTLVDSMDSNACSAPFEYAQPGIPSVRSADIPGPSNAPWSGFGFDMDFDSADVPSDEKIIYDLLSEGDLSTLPTANALPRMPSKDTQRLVKREFASSRQQSEHGPASTYNLSPDMLSSDVLEEIWMEAKRTKWTVAPRPPHEVRMRFPQTFYGCGLLLKPLVYPSE